MSQHGSDRYLQRSDEPCHDHHHNLYVDRAGHYARDRSSYLRCVNRDFHFFQKSVSITSGGYASRMLNNGTHENGHHDTLRQWSTAARWEGITRLYTPEDVARLSGSIHIEYTLARMGAERLWNLLRT